MLGLKEKVFGDSGYSADLMLNSSELHTFRHLVNAQWLQTIKIAHPELSEEAESLGIENYHQIANKLNHNKIWLKSSRVLPKDSVQEIKKLPFIATLKEEFGEFSISDVYDTKQHHGHEEIYWRLVRPEAQTDVGPLHKDTWFHGAFNGGYGMFAEDEYTVKLWIPLFCEKGKSGLTLLGGSHHMDWKYHIEVVDGIPRPKPDEDLSKVGAELIPTEPGNILIFNEEILHGGALNKGAKTRVSAEITMVIKR